MALQLWSRLFVLCLLMLDIIEAASHLRAPGKPVSRQLNGDDTIGSINLCFCDGCNSQVQNTLAEGHSCGDRIQWLQANRNYTEIDACRRVARDEHPDECGACNPDSCQVQAFCGDELATSCTLEVLATEACNDSFGGCHPCGERIRYLVDSKGRNSTIESCEAVGQQFPEECGQCSASSSSTTTGTDSAAPTTGPTTLEPSPNPTSSPPTESPSILSSMNPTSVLARRYSPGEETDGGNICRTATCTQEVLDAMACNDNMGGCHSCGSRINYLVEEEFYAPSDACEIIGYTQFMSVCGGCMPDHLRTPVIPVDPSNLVWADEFDHDGTPDPDKWTFDLGTGDWGWGNNELQYYTDRLDNAFVKDGILNIRAVRESFGSKDYTSARMKSKFHGDWIYGRIQIRARLQNGGARGTWAAAWMLSTDGVHGGWPDSGEIDIMEHVGYDPGVFHGTVHTEAFNHMKGTQRGGDTTAALDDWHIFEIDWSADKIDFLLDDVRYHTFSRLEPSTFREWPFDQQFHVILNVAVGGNWGGIEGIDEAAFQGAGQIMEVDWVRVYSE